MEFVPQELPATWIAYMWLLNAGIKATDADLDRYRKRAEDEGKTFLDVVAEECALIRVLEGK